MTVLRGPILSQFQSGWSVIGGGANNTSVEYNPGVVKKEWSEEEEGEEASNRSTSFSSSCDLSAPVDSYPYRIVVYVKKNSPEQRKHTSPTTLIYVVAVAVSKNDILSDWQCIKEGWRATNGRIDVENAWDAFYGRVRECETEEEENMKREKALEEEELRCKIALTEMKENEQRRRLLEKKRRRIVLLSSVVTAPFFMIAAAAAWYDSDISGLNTCFTFCCASAVAAFLAVVHVSTREEEQKLIEGNEETAFNTTQIPKLRQEDGGKQTPPLTPSTTSNDAPLKKFEITSTTLPMLLGEGEVASGGSLPPSVGLNMDHYTTGDWTFAKEKKGVSMYTKTVPWCDKKSLKITVSVPGVTAATLDHVVNDDPHGINKQSSSYKYDPLYTGKKIVQCENKGKRCEMTTIHQTWKTPVFMVAPRDMASIVSPRIYLTPEEQAHLNLTEVNSKFVDKSKRQQQNICFVQSVMNSTTVPATKGYQRGIIHRGMWLGVEDVERRLLDLTLCISIDPGGYLPASIINLTSDLQLEKVHILRNLLLERAPL